MLSTDAFNYVNVLDKAADASWSRENILTNNIANVNTPGYKRKDLNFENTLKTELGRCKHESLDSKMKDVDLSRLNPSITRIVFVLTINDAVADAELDLLNGSIYTDYSTVSYRLDGNNVDIDTEEVELASEQIRYQGITAGINGQFDRMRSVIK